MLILAFIFCTASTMCKITNSGTYETANNFSYNLRKLRFLNKDESNYIIDSEMFITK